MANRNSRPISWGSILEWSVNLLDKAFSHDKDLEDIAGWVETHRPVDRRDSEGIDYIDDIDSDSEYEYEDQRVRGPMFKYDVHRPLSAPVPTADEIRRQRSQMLRHGHRRQRTLEGDPRRDLATLGVSLSRGLVIRDVRVVESSAVRSLRNGMNIMNIEQYREAMKQVIENLGAGVKSVFSFSDKDMITCPECARQRACRHRFDYKGLNLRRTGRNRHTL